MNTLGHPSPTGARPPRASRPPDARPRPKSAPPAAAAEPDRTSTTTGWHAYRWAGRVITRAGYRRVLDVGCTCPEALSTHLAPSPADISGVGDAPSVAACQGLPGRFLAMDLERPTFFSDEPFDFVIFADGIGRLRDPAPAMAMIRQVLAPDGLVLLAAADRQRTHGRRAWDDDQTSVQWTRPDFLRFVRSCGLCVHATRLMPPDNRSLLGGLWGETLFQARLAPRSPMSCLAVLCGKG
jgi:SAM-dependent methyltransferase